VKKERIIFSGIAVFLTLATIALMAMQYVLKPTPVEKDNGETPLEPNVPKLKTPPAPAPPEKQPERPAQKEKKSNVPFAAVADFIIDPSVNDKSFTGSSFAARLEQRLNKKYKLVERRRISEALEELKLQSSDLAQTPQASEFGKITGAEFIITGTVIKSGGKYILASKIFDLKGQITQKAEISVDNLASISKEDFKSLAKLLTMSQKEQKVKAAANSLVKEAAFHIRKKNYETALKNLEKAYATDPENQEAPKLMLKAKEKLKKQTSDKKRNNEFDARYADGIKSLDEKDLEKAIKQFKKAIKMAGPEHIQEKSR
jgi:hypothetical protein